ncbi:unnamed protein product [Adineta ricciae]|nr:unnamed protein product [Adineta ricciae]
MRALFILLSIGLLVTLIHYSNGNPIESSLSASEEDDSVESNESHTTAPSIDDESDEEKLHVAISDENEDVKLAKALEFLKTVQQSESDSNEKQADEASADSNVAKTNDPKIEKESSEE